MRATTEIDGVKYVIYSRRREYEEAKRAQERGEKVLVARSCALCGDQLLGYVEEPAEAPVCEPGHCGNRPGVAY